MTFFKKIDWLFQLKENPNDTGIINNFSFIMANNNGVVTLKTSSPVWWWNGVKTMTFKYRGDADSEKLAVSDSHFGFGQINNLLNVNVIMVQASPTNPILQINVQVDQKGWQEVKKVIPKAEYSISPSFPVQLAWTEKKYFNWTISGKILTVDGKITIPGVTVTAYNTKNNSVLDSTKSKQDGNYYLSIKVPVSSDPKVELKASKNNYRFYSVLISNSGNYDIKGIYLPPTPTKYNVVGKVEDKNGNGIPQAKLEYCEGVGDSFFVNTDAGGYFEFKQVPLGGTIRIFNLPEEYQNCSFSPVSITPSNFANVIIEPSYCSSAPNSYLITGSVVDQNGDPISGAKIKYGNIIVYSQSDGSFNFSTTKLDGILIVSKTGYETTQIPISSRNLGKITLNEILTSTFSIKGHVEDPNGGYIANAIVSYGSLVTTTDQHGYFSFKNIQLGKSLKVSKKGYNAYSQIVESSESNLIVVLTPITQPSPTTKAYVYMAEDEYGNYLPGIKFVINGKIYTTNLGGEISVKLNTTENPADAVTKIYDPSGSYKNFILKNATDMTLIYQGQKSTPVSKCPQGYHMNSAGKCEKDTEISQNSTTSSDSSNKDLLIFGAMALAILMFIKR